MRKLKGKVVVEPDKKRNGWMFVMFSDGSVFHTKNKLHVLEKIRDIGGATCEIEWRGGLKTPKEKP